MSARRKVRMNPSEVLREARHDEYTIWKEYEKWLKSVGGASDFWVTWREAWKAAFDRAIVLAEAEE